MKKVGYMLTEWAYLSIPNTRVVGDGTFTPVISASGKHETAKPVKYGRYVFSSEGLGCWGGYFNNHKRSWRGESSLW